MGKPLQAVDDYAGYTKFTDLGLSPVASLLPSCTVSVQARR